MSLVHAMLYYVMLLCNILDYVIFRSYCNIVYSILTCLGTPCRKHAAKSDGPAQVVVRCVLTSYAQRHAAPDTTIMP